MKDKYERNIIKQMYLSTEALIHCSNNIEYIDTFRIEEHRVFFKTLVMLFRKNINCSLSAVRDALDETDNGELIETFTELVDETYEDESEYRYHVDSLLNRFKKIKLLELSNGIKDEIGNLTASEVIDKAHAILSKLDTGDIESHTMKQSLGDTIQDICDYQEGKKSSVVYTGLSKWDKYIALSPERLLLIAAQKKIGKTRFAVNLVDRLLDKNPKDVAVQWYTFEMPRKDMVRCFLSKKMTIGEDELLVRNGARMTDAQRERLPEVMEYYSKYNLEFIDTPLNIFKISSKFKEFCRKNEGKFCLCVIDNLGLISPHMNSGLEYENELARILKNMRDETKGCIMVLHHMTKESENVRNKETGYEPRVDNIRGSGRLTDYANQVVLLHRPDHYADVMIDAKNSGALNQIKGMFIVIVGLNRNGGTGKFLLKHKIEYCQFYQYSDA